MLRVLLIFIFTLQSYGSLSEWWFRFRNQDCVQDGVRMNENLISSHEKLVHCYSDVSISGTQISSFIEQTANARVELETWIYMQNNSKKYLQAASQSLSFYSGLLSDLKNKNDSQNLKDLKESYLILKALYDEKNHIESCDNPFERMADRIRLVKNYCDVLKDTDKEKRLEEVEGAINEMEGQFPLFKNPLMRAEFDKPSDERIGFNASLTEVVNDSIETLQSKMNKHQEISKMSLSKSNIDKVLNDRETISEYVASEYRPDNKNIYEGGEIKSISLLTAQCRINQRFHTHKIDNALTGLGKDIALLAGSMVITGGASLFYHGTRAANLALKAKKIRTAIIATEGTIAGLDITNVKAIKKQCKETARTASTFVSVPESMREELEDCRELINGSVTSYALAVLGGAAATKLSKMDIQDIRLNRIAKRGKEKLLQVSSAVKSQVIKQADFILEQVEQMTDSMSGGQLAFATEGMNGTNRLDQNVQYNQNPGQSGGRNHNRSIASRKKKNKTKNDDTPSKLALHNRVNNLLRDLPCYRDKSCKNELIYLENGLKNLVKNEEGIKLVKRILSQVQDRKQNKITEILYEKIKNCLKVKKNQMKCNPKQVEIVVDMIEFDWRDINPHPHFFRQVVRSIDFNASSERMDEVVTFISHQIKSSNGKVSGKYPDVEIKNNTFFIDGVRVKDRLEKVKAISLIREERAIKLLQKLGFDVDILPEGVIKRKEQGVQQRFQKLAAGEDLARNRNPDIILNNNQIADIYSPLNGLSIENASNIAKGILSKTEGTNFHRVYTKVEEIVDDTADGVEEALMVEREVRHYGKRQTNRVVVYADEIKGSVDEVVKRVKEEIASHSPRHIHEAVVVFDSPSGPQVITMWP